MKRTMMNSAFVTFCLLSLLLGLFFIIGNVEGGIDDYIIKMSQTPTRYVIVLISLLLDYIIFENINHYVIIVRYKSVFRFLIISILVEITGISVLLFSLHIPVLLLNIQNIHYCFLVLVNSVSCIIVITLSISIIRFINIWLNNRALSLGMFLVVFAILDFLLNHLNYYDFKSLIFDFSYIFTISLRYPDYFYINYIILFLIVIFTIITSIMITKKDYVLRSKEDD